jgi:hypothetical protein
MDRPPGPQRSVYFLSTLICCCHTLKEQTKIAIFSLEGWGGEGVLQFRVKEIIVARNAAVYSPFVALGHLNREV